MIAGNLIILVMEMYKFWEIIKALFSNMKSLVLMGL
jgi:hypothetical protein